MAHTYAASGSDVSKHGEEFVDILAERRRSCDLGHALRTFSPLPYQGAPACTTAELNRAVLESQYLRYIAREVVMETGLSAEEVRQEMGRLLEEMSQNLQLGFIRLMGYTLTKVFKRLFKSIYVNMDGLSTLQQTIQETPVILMPNHRSYVDFLAVSYLLFTYDIPVPVIAAGIPLAGMKMVGEILRRSGAFFIRRAIGSDKLYWAVLSEYVKTIIRKGFAPLEFFVEGLRSRTLKSLTPKLGMMHMVLEPFFKSEVFDITLVPVSISYDRVLEESLLAHELLGVPKPKESTTGLLKATKVLQEDYGSMHVNFGRPLSVRQLCEGKIKRRQYNLTPRDLPQRPSAEVQACVSWLAHLMVRLQEQGCVLSPWSLMACVLLQAPVTLLTREGLSWQQLSHRTLWLRGLALDCGARLNWPAQTTDSDVMSSSLSLHRFVVRRRSGRVYLVQEEEEEEREGPARRRRRRRGRSRPEEGVLRTASAVLMLAAYRNQSLHVFVRPALLATALHVTASTRRDELFSFFSFLCGLFSHEFIYVPGHLSQDFEEACLLLATCGAVNTTEQEVTPTDTGPETLSFLRSLIQPFIDSYQVMFKQLRDDSVHPLTEELLLPAVRDLATRLILSGELHTYEALSSDTQRNAAAALRRLGAVAKRKASGELTVDKAAVGRIADVLSGKIPAHGLRSTPDARL